MATTQLMPHGTPGRLYGSFAGRALPDFANIQAYENTSVSASPYSVGSYTAAAGENRIVFWAESAEVTSPGSGATAVTWGGNAMSLVDEIAQPGNWARLWYILEADFPSGATGDIVATIGDLGDNAHIKSRAFTVPNLAQQAAEATNKTAQTTDPVNTSITPLTSTAFLLDVSSCGNAGTIAVTQGPAQVVAVADAAAGGRGMGIGISKRYATDTSAVSMGWDHNGTPNRWAHVVAAFARA